MQHTMVYGTTEPQDFELFSDGEALVGTGLTPTIEFREAGVSATVAWLDQAAGTIRITNMTGMSANSKYHFRIRLTDVSLNFGYCPNGYAPDEWAVVSV